MAAIGDVLVETIWQEKRHPNRWVKVYRVGKEDVLIRTIAAVRGEWLPVPGSRLSETTISRFIRDFEQMPSW